jgi:hypothetical protein
MTDGLGATWTMGTRAAFKSLAKEVYLGSVGKMNADTDTRIRAIVHCV